MRGPDRGERSRLRKDILPEVIDDLLLMVTYTTETKDDEIWSEVKPPGAMLLLRGLALPKGRGESSMVLDLPLGSRVEVQVRDKKDRLYIRFPNP